MHLNAIAKFSYMKTELKKKNITFFVSSKLYKVCSTLLMCFVVRFVLLLLCCCFASYSALRVQWRKRNKIHIYRLYKTLAPSRCISYLTKKWIIYINAKWNALCSFTTTVVLRWCMQVRIWVRVKRKGRNEWKWNEYYHSVENVSSA